MLLMSSLLMALFGWTLPDAHDGLEDERDDLDFAGAGMDDPPVVPLDELLADWTGDSAIWDDPAWDADWPDSPDGADTAGPSPEAVAENDPAGADPDLDPYDDLPPIEPVEVLYLTDPVHPGSTDSPAAAQDDPFQAMFDAVTGLTPPGGAGDAEMLVMMDGKKVILPRG